MGKARYIYLTDENNNKLDGIPNKSELINKLLDDYFKKIMLEDMNEEEIKIWIEKEKLRIDFENKIKELENANH